MNISKKTFAGIFLLSLALTSCNTQKETVVTPEPVNTAETSDLTTYTNADLGFTFSYPSELIAKENSAKTYLELSTKETSDAKKVQEENPYGTGGIPPNFGIKMNSLGDESLEKFVLNDTGFGDFDSLSEVEEFNSETESNSTQPTVYEYKTIGDNKILRIATSDMFYTISYYVENTERNSVISFSVYDLSDDNDTLNKMLSSLQLN